jgi:magnesium chelatase subunit H
MATQMFEDIKEYLNWYESRKDLPKICAIPWPPVSAGAAAHPPRDWRRGPLRRHGAGVGVSGGAGDPVFSGGWTLPSPSTYFFDPLDTHRPIVDSVVSLTGFALVGGPARQDHPKAIETLKRLNRPYMVALPLVFQTTEEWEESDLGLHPIQVALQMAIPELDGAIEPIVLSGRDGMTGRAITLQDRISSIAQRAMKWGNLRRKPKLTKKLAITVFSFPPDKGNVGTAAYLDVFGSIYKVLEAMKRNGYDVQDLPESPEALMQEVIHDAQAQYASPS